MKPLWYSDQKVCDISPSEFEALCLLLPYWGLKISDEGTEISGALSTFMLGIHGLSQEKVKELKQLLQHTGINLTTDDNEKCHQRFYVDFHENHPMPLALKTPDQQLYYLNPATKVQFPVQNAIHKGITLKRKSGPIYLAVQPAYEKQVTEWISYLVIQTFLRPHFESLSSISESTFVQCTENVLENINQRFAMVQLPDTKQKAAAATPAAPIRDDFPQIPQKEINAGITSKATGQQKAQNSPKQRVSVPPIRPFSSSGSLITNEAPQPYHPGMFKNRPVQPINPFRSNANKEKPIQPFHPHNEGVNETSVIRPFHSKQHTPQTQAEYTNKASRIFRQRRDGK